MPIKNALKVNIMILGFPGNTEDKNNNAYFPWNLYHINCSCLFIYFYINLNRKAVDVISSRGCISIHRATVWDTAKTTEIHLTFEGQEDSWNRGGWQGRQRVAVDRDSWEHRDQKGPQHQSPDSLHDHFIQRPTRDLFGPAWEGREEGGEDQH